MNIDKFKHQHAKIYECIHMLRQYSTSGVAENAREIAQMVVSMSSLIKLHLSVEDALLYPALRSSNIASAAKIGNEYQEDMKLIAKSYEEFARNWNTEVKVTQNPRGFKNQANIVLKRLHTRIRQEDTNFYPMIEAI